MDHLEFVRNYMDKVKPRNLRFKYQVLEEKRFLADLEAKAQLAEENKQRRKDEEEVKKIVAGLEREKSLVKVADCRRRQLTQMAPELRTLNHYIAEARNAQFLIAQMKLEDIEADRRYEMARKQADNIRAGLRAMHEREKQKETEQKREAEFHGSIVKEQIKDHEEHAGIPREIEKRELNELRKRMDMEDEKCRQDMLAMRIENARKRKEALDFLQRKMAQREQEKVGQSNYSLELLEMQRIQDARQQKIIADRNERIQQKANLSAKLGQEVFVINKAKERQITNFVDGFINEKVNLDNLREARETRAAVERRQLMEQSMRSQKAAIQGRKERLAKRAEDLVLKRLTSPSHIESEMRLLHKRKERELWVNLQFMKAKELDRKEREAERISKVPKEIYGEEHDQEVEALRLQILNEQPISVLRYMPGSLTHSDYLPEPLNALVREQIRQDPIPMLDVRRHQRYAKRIQLELEPVVCCKLCPPPKPLSNIF